MNVVRTRQEGQKLLTPMSGRVKEEKSPPCEHGKAISRIFSGTSVCTEPGAAIPCHSGMAPQRWLHGPALVAAALSLGLLLMMRKLFAPFGRAHCITTVQCGVIAAVVVCSCISMKRCSSMLQDCKNRGRLGTCNDWSAGAVARAFYNFGYRVRAAISTMRQGRRKHFITASPRLLMETFLVLIVCSAHNVHAGCARECGGLFDSVCQRMMCPTGAFRNSFSKRVMRWYRDNMICL